MGKVDKAAVDGIGDASINGRQHVGYSGGLGLL